MTAHSPSRLCSTLRNTQECPHKPPQAVPARHDPGGSKQLHQPHCSAPCQSQQHVILCCTMAVTAAHHIVLHHGSHSSRPSCVFAACIVSMPTHAPYALCLQLHVRQASALRANINNSTSSTVPPWQEREGCSPPPAQAPACLTAEQAGPEIHPPRTNLKYC